MKKQILLATTMLALLAFSACGDSKANVEVPSTTDFVEKNEEVTEVEEEPEETGEKEEIMGTSLTYIGHASVKIKSKEGVVIYIDPNYMDYDYEDEADIILVTHGHDDHKPCSKVKLKDGGKQLTNLQMLKDGEYKTEEINGVTIEAVPAGNQNHDIKYCVGYIVTVDGIKIYHAGDTSTLDTMSELASKNIDYAMYPIDGVYNMDAVEATSVANTVKAKHNIPIHEFNEGNDNKADNFTPEGRLVLEYGETIEITNE